MKLTPFLVFAAVVWSACADPDAIPGFTLGDGSEAERVAMDRLRASAESGDLHSEYLVVWFEDWAPGDHGRGVPKLESLAERGSAEAARLLARAYWSGTGVEPDYKTAAAWTRLASELGDPVARTEIASYDESRSDT